MYRARLVRFPSLSPWNKIRQAKGALNRHPMTTTTTTATIFALVLPAAADRNLTAASSFSVALALRKGRRRDAVEFAAYQKAVYLWPNWRKGHNTRANEQTTGTAFCAATRKNGVVVEFSFFVAHIFAIRLSLSPKRQNSTKVAFKASRYIRQTAAAEQHEDFEFIQHTEARLFDSTRATFNTNCVERWYCGSGYWCLDY